MAKYLTDTFVGFFCGVPIKINSDDSNIDEYLGRLSLYNDEDNHNSELAKGADIHGDFHELLYVHEDAEICYTEVSPSSIILLVDDSSRATTIFVRHKDSNKIERGSWSDSKEVQYSHEEP